MLMAFGLASRCFNTYIKAKDMKLHYRYTVQLITCKRTKFGEKIQLTMKNGVILSLPARMTAPIRKSFEDNLAPLYEGVNLQDFQVSYHGMIGENEFLTPDLRFYKNGIVIISYDSSDSEGHDQ